MTDEQGRIFGKISIVDILAILAVILIAASIYMRLGSSGVKTLSAAYSSEYEYTVIAENLPAHIADALKKSVGEDLFSDGEKIGVIEKIDLVTPSLIPIEQPDGRVVTVQHPEKSDVRMTVKCLGTEAHAGILAEGNRIISNGAEFELETRYTVSPARINNVHRIN